MILSSDFYKIIDEIRRSKGITIAELCDGIISERTYYRYMLSTKGIRFDLFSKLAKKLDVKPYDLIHYGVFSYKGDPGLTKFMYRVQVHHYDDVDELYKMMQGFKGETKEVTELVSVYVKKYEYSIGKINKNDYQLKLNETRKIFQDIPLSNETVAFFYTLYLMEFPYNEDISLNKIVNHYINSDIRISVSFKMWGMDNLLSTMMNLKEVDNDLFINLINKMDTLMGFYNCKYYTMRNQLYHAYSAKLQGIQGEMEENLYRHILGLIVLIGHKEYQDRLSYVEEIFKVDGIELVKNKSKSFLQSGVIKVS